MVVTLTSPVEGLQPGDTYTGGDEAWLLASGYAKQAGYTGPGVANTGNADTSITNNREFSPVTHDIAHGSDLPQGGTNDGVKLGPAAEPTVAYTGTDGPVPNESDDFDGFANAPVVADDTETTTP